MTSADQQLLCSRSNSGESELSSLGSSIPSTMGSPPPPSTAPVEDELAIETSIDMSTLSLEGMLHYRRGRSSGSSFFQWKRRFVILSLREKGSITVFREPPDSWLREVTPEKKKIGSTVLRTGQLLLHDQEKARDGTEDSSPPDVELHVPTHLPWVVKDVQNDSATFVVEVYDRTDGILSEPFANEVFSDSCYSFQPDCANSPHVVGGRNGVAPESTSTNDSGVDLLLELKRAREKGKPIRIYFYCKSSREKHVWLRAFTRIQRLSNEFRKKRGLLGTLASPLQHRTVRTRSRANESFAQEVRQLDNHETLDCISELNKGIPGLNDVEELVLGPSSTSKNARDKEYKVIPTHVYPNRWMTRTELREEMVLPSETFHDLRVEGCKQKEIGSLRVEVLQCMGLPRLDRASDNDAVVYMVLGSYAFATDVILNKMNPMWLRKTRRACEFPIFHAYARLYVGVFDDDGERARDDFAGRVVIDLARLRPRSTYDVTLPLRLSAHVYSRRRRGAIRLRFTLNWNSEREALMSYIPKKLDIPLPQHSKPNFDVTVMCADPKALRNIAITVHSAHLPGRFTFQQMRATIREINYTRKYIFVNIRIGIKETRQWKCPTTSFFVFFAWMHCVYANSFSLVPAYLVLFFLLHLVRNYAKYGIDGPAQRGILPPSWEELFMAMVRRNEKGAIEPIELLNSAPADRRTELERLDLPSRVNTHVPRGKAVFRSLGFLPEYNLEDLSTIGEDLEFPFANGKDYPKFTVKECLAGRKDVNNSETSDKGPNGGSDCPPDANTDGETKHRFSLQAPLHALHMDEIIHQPHQDPSGLNFDDEEEVNFDTSKAVVAAGRKAASSVVASGRATLNRTASTLNNAATGLTGMAGLHHVVTPIKSGFTSVNQMIAPMQSITHPVRRVESTDSEVTFVSNGHSNYGTMRDICDTNSIPSISDNNPTESENMIDHVDPTLVWPQQNIDVEGPSSGKKLTDDLSEIKDRVHDLTWHNFDDHTYVQKNRDAVFFGQAKKSEKRRKADVSRELDKLLNVGPYSHSNPFVARVGLYVEPITGCAQGFLCLFRAGFNVMTWRDPILTFWLSIFSGALAIVLFVFPWRIFLFLVGIALVGPQNWAIRVLRERGHLPPVPERRPKRRSARDSGLDNIDWLPTDQPIFCSHNMGKSTAAERAAKADLREMHHIVVPYSPLMYQRCYDWPPEPEYAQVKRVDPDETRRHCSDGLTVSERRDRRVLRNQSSLVESAAAVPNALWRSGQSGTTASKKEK